MLKDRIGGKRRKRLLKMAIFLVASFFVWKFVFGLGKGPDFSGASKRVILNNNGLESYSVTNASTVREFMDKEKIVLGAMDVVYPSVDTKIFSGTKILVQRAKKIKVRADGNEYERYTFEDDIESAVLGARIELGEYDITSVPRDELVHDNMEVEITRVSREEEVVKKDIDFKKVAKRDAEMSWREEKVEVKGEKGVKEIKYEVIYHDEKEIARKVIESKVTKEPVDEVVTKGDYVKTGKLHTGWASWYAQPIHLKNAWPSISGHYAANPWLPKGSYVKVTNKANGKSVIARINDRGPFGPNRIIDLDKAAFASIASLGAGIIDVKMEEVVN